MKRLVIILLVTSSFLFPQDEEELTRMEKIVSNTGQILKLENFILPDIVAYNEKLHVKVRRATMGREAAYDLLLTKEDKYGAKSVAIAEEDLKEVLYAFQDLIVQSASESSSADYLENKFTTDDGFQIGYAKGSSITWFVMFDRYGKSTVLFDNPDGIKNALANAIFKIEELKAGK